MIRVNLLPAELLKPEGTPIQRFMIIIGGVVLVSASLCLFVWLHVVVLPKEEQNLSQIEQAVKDAKRKADRYDKLVEAKKAIETRKVAFEGLSGERVIWSKKLDQLSRILGLQKVWLETLAVSSTKGPQGGTVFRTSSDTRVSVTDEAKFVAYRKSLVSDDEYWNDFQMMNDPGLKTFEFKMNRKAGDRTITYKEQKGFQFTLVQTMKEIGAPEPKSPGKKVK